MRPVELTSEWCPGTLWLSGFRELLHAPSARSVLSPDQLQLLLWLGTDLL